MRTDTVRLAKLNLPTDLLGAAIFCFPAKPAFLTLLARESPVPTDLCQPHGICGYRMKDLLLLIESSGPAAQVALAELDAQGWTLLAEAPALESSELAEQPQMQHTALLLPLVKQVLAKAEVLQGQSSSKHRATDNADGHRDMRLHGFARLAAVAVSSGPGSYTALRAGLSSAKGLCLALDIPLLKCDTLRGLALEALALVARPGSGLSAKPPGQVLVLLPARREEVYFGLYDARGVQLQAPGVAVLDGEWVQKLLANGLSTVCGPDGALLKSFCESMTEAASEAVNQVLVPLAANNLLAECQIRMKENDYDELASVTPDYLRAPHITQARTRV